MDYDFLSKLVSEDRGLIICIGYRGSAILVGEVKGK
jgi:hypothetical protein